MAIDFKALAAKAVADGVDMTQAKTGGGGDYEPPAEGPTRLRFIAYIELGKQKETIKGKTQTKEKVLLTFELSGPKHQPKVLDDGTKIPHRISITETLSLNEKANFYKLFTRMNYAGKAKHMVELLGEAYKGRVIHRKYKKKDGSEGVAVDLKIKGEGYTIEPPRYEQMNPETGELEVKVLPVDPPLTEQRCFLWNYADMDQWNSIFIEGEYEARKNDKGEVVSPARSKNVYQNKIKLAENFNGSLIHQLLVSNGANLDIPDAESAVDPEADDAPEDDAPEQQAAQKPAGVPQGAAADDALAGVM